MFLRTNIVRLPKPGTKFRVDIRGRRQPEVMDVITRRDRVDAPEARVLQTAREHDMAVEPLPLGRHLRERHPHLERDPRLFRQHDDGTARGGGAPHGVEQHADGGILSTEMMCETVARAGVRLVAVGEAAPARATGPERTHWH